MHTPTGHSSGYVNTAEVGPQASLYFPAGSLALPPGTRLLLLSVTPEAPTSGVRLDGRITGNVYRVAATADAEPISLRPQSGRPSLQLRAPSSRQPGPVLEHRDATGWHRTVRTTRTSVDTYQAEINALGDWALVQLTSGAPSSNESGVNADLLAGASPYSS